MTTAGRTSSSVSEEGLASCFQADKLQGDAASGVAVPGSWMNCEYLKSACCPHLAPSPAGMLPLARELLRRGTVVIIAANKLPAINDITAAELDALLPQASGEMHCLPGACVPARVVQCVGGF